MEVEITRWESRSFIISSQSGSKLLGPHDNTPELSRGSRCHRLFLGLSANYPKLCFQGPVSSIVRRRRTQSKPLIILLKCRKMEVGSLW